MSLRKIPMFKHTLLFRLTILYAGLFTLTSLLIFVLFYFKIHSLAVEYADYFLSQVIQLLKKNSDQLNTAMIYVSDHGQSLGEKGIYLHGLPYFIAPDEQKHIPFLLWISDEFSDSAGIDKVCLKEHSADEYSHDNIFHSVLGLIGVKTDIYNPRLDIFAGCKS